MNTLKKKYGLPTAIAMVVGIVVGSGVFFKAEAILQATEGNMWQGIVAWIAGGLVMLSCLLTFSVLASKYERVNGIVDYAEVTVGKRFGLMLGWFMSSIYYPSLTGVLAWVSARYTCVLLDFSIVGGECLAITMFYLVAIFALNGLAPKLSGKFQVSTTVIKLVPLLLMAVVGTISGLTTGLTVDNFTQVTTPIFEGNGFFVALCATAFAYEGWIIATSINAELKNSKKNLPKALIIGGITIITIYICYYIGLAGGVTIDEIQAGGEAAAKLAFSSVFGNFAGTLLFVFIVISCLGTTNGLMMGCVRGFYSIANRNVGPAVDTLSQIDPKTNVPTNSAILGLLFAGAWALFFFGANLSTDWFGFFSFDSSELPIITIYALYVPMFVCMMIKEKDLSALKRFVLPGVSIVASIFMIVASVYSHGGIAAPDKDGLYGYLVVFAVFMIVGFLLLFVYKPQQKVEETTETAISEQ